MKRITIYQKGIREIQLFDKTENDLDKYCEELSKMFQVSNIVILETTSGTFIGRPSKLSSIVVEDVQVKEPDAAPKVEIHQDIITDLD